MRTGPDSAAPPWTIRCPTASASPQLPDGAHQLGHGRARAEVALPEHGIVRSSSSRSLSVLEPALTTRTRTARTRGVRPCPLERPTLAARSSRARRACRRRPRGCRRGGACARRPSPGAGGGALAEAGHAVDDVHDQVEAVEVVEHDHVEGRGRGALLLVAAHVEVGVVGAAVGQAVDQPRIAVVGEDDRLVGGEQRVELGVGQAVRVLAVGGCSRIRSTTLTTRTRRSGRCGRSRSAAASVSSVGTSPAQASTTSGSPPSSLPAHSQMPSPRAQCSDRPRPSSASRARAACRPRSR